MDAEIVIDAKAELGEGPSWDGNKGVLYWVDISQGLVHIYEPKGHNIDRTVSAGKNVSCVVPIDSRKVAITRDHGFYSLDLDTGKLTEIGRVQENLQDGTRFNDGKCDTKGRFWAGTMDVKETRPSGALYCLSKDRQVKKILSGVTISNGLGWSPDDSTMYYIDTPTRKVSAFDYEVESGDVKNRRTALDLSNQPGEPDGMAVDSEGMIWVAHWGGFCLTRWDPKLGRKIETVKVPAANVTSCCFGGKDLDELYITTARSGLDQDSLTRYPLAGGLFMVKVNVQGLRTNFTGYLIWND
jgi:sugar lactone lactonase YvrE